MVRAFSLSTSRRSELMLTSGPPPLALPLSDAPCRLKHPTASEPPIMVRPAARRMLACVAYRLRAHVLFCTVARDDGTSSCFLLLIAGVMGTLLRMCMCMMVCVCVSARFTC